MDILDDGAIDRALIVQGEIEIKKTEIKCMRSLKINISNNKMISFQNCSY